MYRVVGGLSLFLFVECFLLDQGPFCDSTGTCFRLWKTATHGFQSQGGSIIVAPCCPLHAMHLQSHLVAKSRNQTG